MSMESSTNKKYREIEAELLKLREVDPTSESTSEKDQEMTDLLAELWWKLTEEEREQVNKRCQERNNT